MNPTKTVAAVVHCTINQRITQIARYLADKAPHVADEQTHLVDDTEEHAYWHHGYMTALRDIQMMLNSGELI